MLHDDLLEQAHFLVAREEMGKPKQASLRRAVSTAYYALFHLLIFESAALLPSAPPTLRQRATRAFTHEEMKAVCSAIAASKPNTATAAILSPDQFSEGIRRVAEAFADVQDARHKADYDLSQRYTRTGVLTLLAQVDSAFSDWKRVRTRDEARVFLMALLLQKRWSR